MELQIDDKDDKKSLRDFNFCKKNSRDGNFSMYIENSSISAIKFGWFKINSQILFVKNWFEGLSKYNFCKEVLFSVNILNNKE